MRHATWFSSSVVVKIVSAPGSTPGIIVFVFFWRHGISPQITNSLFLWWKQKRQQDRDKLTTQVLRLIRYRTLRSNVIQRCCSFICGSEICSYCKTHHQLKIQTSPPAIRGEEFLGVNWLINEAKKKYHWQMGDSS